MEIQGSTIGIGTSATNTIEVTKWDSVDGTFVADGSTYVLYTVPMPTNGDIWAGEFFITTRNDTTGGDNSAYVRHGFVVTTSGGAPIIRDDTSIYTYNNNVGSGVAVGQPVINISGTDARIRLTSFNIGGDTISYRLNVVSIVTP